MYKSQMLVSLRYMYLLFLSQWCIKQHFILHTSELNIAILSLNVFNKFKFKVVQKIFVIDILKSQTVFCIELIR